MTELFKNNQIALRHCLLYEFLQGKSAENAFVDFSRTIEKSVIDKREIQILFRRFAKGKFYKNSRKHDQISAIDIIQSDKKALRTCILYQSLKSYKKTKKNPYSLHPMDPEEIPNIWWEEHDLFRFNPSFVMFEEFRKVIRIDFREFDFWYYRFLNGKFDLNFERDEDKKIYELMDMPIDVMKNIVDYLDVVDRSKLEKTSRCLRLFTSNQPFFYDTIDLHSTDRIAFLTVSNKPGITYKARDENECILEISEMRYLVEGVPHWKLFIFNLKMLLKNVKIHVKLLDLSVEYLSDPSIAPFADEFLETLENAMKSSTDRLIFVEHLDITTENFDQIVRILPYLKPGYLKKITLRSESYDNLLMHQIQKIDHWKQAKELDLLNFVYPGSIRDFFHLERFSVQIETLSMEGIMDIKEMLFKSPHFHDCYIEFSNLPIDIEKVNEHLGDRYEIPDSNEYFEINVEPRSVYITRKSQ